jgi:hypothetical protein
MLGGMSKPSDSASRWREIVRGHAESGLSVAAYCRRARVPQSSFYAWRRKLRDAGTFAEVRVTPEADAADDLGALELHLRRGRRVIVRPGFDRQTLRDLVATRWSCGSGDPPAVADATGWRDQTRIWLCTGPTDMRRGFDRLAEQAQQVTRQHPQSGHLFVFRSAAAIG